MNLLTNRAIQPAAGVLDTTAETYEYDGASRLIQATDNDSTVIFGYDSLNRRTSENQNGKLINYTYDKVNNLTSIQYPNTRIIEREFDLLNRINKIKQGGTQIANMEFIGRTYRMLSKGYQNGDVVKYLYDQGRRMTGIDAKNLNQQIINQYAYGYNKVNLKTYEQRLHDASKGDVYAYDAINRIKNIKFDAADPTDPLTTQFAKAKTYNLDKVDNILKIVENKNNVDTEIVTEMTASNAQLNQYSKFDQWTMAYDQNGNTTQKGTQQFAYNFCNQLVRAIDGGSTITMKYDPLGRRIEKSGSGNTIRFYYAGNQVIEERNGSDVTKQYVYGNGIDELLRLDVYSGSTSTPYYVHTNDIGSTTAITDSTGALVERVSYDTFGLPSFTNASGQPSASSSIGNSILFQGREYDPELNLYNYRARYYDPIMGRFMQTDPMGYQDSMNLYQGMNMNPGNYEDPLGLSTLTVNITRNRINSQSITGRYSIEWSDFVNGNETMFTYILGQDILNRIANINAGDYVSLELRWNGNLNNQSSIPLGLYEFTLSESNIAMSCNTQVQNLPEFYDVPGGRGNNMNTGANDPIRIHQGNAPFSANNNPITRGCILIGTDYDPSVNENWITNSCTRVAELINLVNDVRVYDSLRGDSTRTYTNITMDFNAMLNTFLSQLGNGANAMSILEFATTVGDMWNNQKNELLFLENALNSYFGNYLPPNSKIYVNSKSNIRIGHAPIN